jgi:hypothetical protein
MKFTLKINLGNAAMMDPADVAAALEETAAKLRDEGFEDGKVRDLNGNTVGEYGVRR